MSLNLLAQTQFYFNIAHVSFCIIEVFPLFPSIHVQYDSKSTLVITWEEDDNQKCRKTFMFYLVNFHHVCGRRQLSTQNPFPLSCRILILFRLAVCFSKNTSPGSLAAKGGHVTQFWTMKQKLGFSWKAVTFLTKSPFQLPPSVLTSPGILMQCLQIRCLFTILTWQT